MASYGFFESIARDLTGPGILGGKFQIRLDAKDRLYTISYPQTYFTAPSGGTAVVTTHLEKSYWLNNPSLTLGLSYLF